MVDLVPLEDVGPPLATAKQREEEIRLTFRKLYVEEKKTIEQVTIELKELHGYDVTYVKPMMNPLAPGSATTDWTVRSCLCWVNVS